MDNAMYGGTTLMTQFREFYGEIISLKKWGIEKKCYTIFSCPQFFGKFDTYFGSNRPVFAGAWGVYPYLPSGNILVSDINSGLYILGLDIDDDGLAATEELLYGTNPEMADTDGDGLLDGDEVTYGYDPLVFDEVMGLYFL